MLSGACETFTEAEQMPANHLSNQQLCDLVNYLLGLPVRKKPNGGFVRREGLNPCVTYSWGVRASNQLERWADDELSQVNLMPLTIRRRPHRPPICFRNWLGTR
jgi:hypothetical protein